MKKTRKKKRNGKIILPLLATGSEAVGKHLVAILPFLEAILKIEFWAQAIFKSAYPKSRIMHSALKEF
jgi:hypothetical protein